MAASVLSGILKVDKDTKKAILSIDATLQKIYKGDADKNKREIKQRKEELQAKKTAEKEKNILEDILGELKKTNKGDKDKKKKSLMEELFDLLKGPIIAFAGTVAGAIGSVVSAVAPFVIAIAGAAAALKAISDFGNLWKGNKNKPGIASNIDFGKGANLGQRIRDEKEDKNYQRGKPGYRQRAEWTTGTAMQDGLTSPYDRDKMRGVYERLLIDLKSSEAEALEEARPKVKVKTNERGGKQGEREEKGTIDPKVKTKIEKDYEERRRRLEESYSRVFGPGGGAEKKQRGGPITVPGSGSGDKVPMMLPPGAFVMNRNASAMLQNGGLVPTLLEPGERVFGPSDVSPMHHMLNSMIPRFQEGGMVSKKDTSKEKESNKGTTAILQGGGPGAVITTGQSLIKQGFTVAEHPNFIKGPPSKFDPSGKARIGGHSSGSLHYSGLALDVTDWRNGDWKGRTRQLAEDVYKQRDALKLTQIIHDPWGAWFKGESKPGPAIGGHPEHLHLGFGKGQGGPLGDPLNKDIASSETGGESKPQSALDMMMGVVGGLGEVGKVISGVMGTFANIAGGELMAAMFGMPAQATGSPPPTTGAPGGISGSSQPLTGDMASKAKMMFDYAKSKGLSDAHAKGLIANMIRESSLRVDSPSGDDGGSGGLFQWKGGRGRRMAQAVPDWKTNWKGQIDYALVEPGEPGQQFKNSKFSSAEEAAYFWMDKWERPSDRGAGQEKHKRLISQMKFQQGGIVNMSSSQSPNTSRFKHAQEEFAQMIADKSGSPTIIVAGGGGGSQGPTVVSTPNAQSSVPSLPDGPSSIQSAEYFYRLNMGSVF